MFNTARIFPKCQTKERLFLSPRLLSYLRFRGSAADDGRSARVGGTAGQRMAGWRPPDHINNLTSVKVIEERILWTVLKAVSCHSQNFPLNCLGLGFGKSLPYHGKMFWYFAHQKAKSYKTQNMGYSPNGFYQHYLGFLFVKQ